MNDQLLQYALAAFVTLLVVVDPFGVVPIFVSLTSRETAVERRRILARAVVIAFVVAVFFFLAGRGLLGYLGVTVHAFAISGGVLLFATALPMLFGQRPGLQGPERGEQAAVGNDISVFPLAIPLLAGPGAVTSILLLAGQADGQPRLMAILLAAITVVFALTWAVLRLGEALVARIGEGGIHVATRVMGIILAALAVQFVLNGIAGFVETVQANG